MESAIARSQQQCSPQFPSFLPQINKPTGLGSCHFTRHATANKPGVRVQVTITEFPPSTCETDCRLERNCFPITPNQALRRGQA